MAVEEYLKIHVVYYSVDLTQIVFTSKNNGVVSECYYRRAV
jgi:hypothetical protein